MALFQSQKPEVQNRKPVRTTKTALVTESLAYRVLRQPRITEKTHTGLARNQYVFEVAVTATKKTVKQVVESLYGVHILKVNITSIPSQWRLWKGTLGKNKRMKKAIVTLRAGETIDVFKSA